jgi:hypothetical protein
MKSVTSAKHALRVVAWTTAATIAFVGCYRGIDPPAGEFLLDKLTEGEDDGSLDDPDQGAEGDSSSTSGASSDGAVTGDVQSESGDSTTADTDSDGSTT